MKSERVCKNFSALSFDAGKVTTESVPANLNPPPRLTPESVQDFDVQHDGSAEVGSPQDERLATTRHCRGWDVAEPKQFRLGRWTTPTQPCPGSE